MAPTVTLLNGDSLILLNSESGFRAPETEAQGWTNGKPFALLKADAAVTDPPYGFDFDGTMCKGDWAEGQKRVEKNDWDSFTDGRRFATAAEDAEVFAKFCEQWMRAIQVVLWPGAHVAAFTADRTLDSLGRGMRLSGLEVVRAIFWLYASGQVKNPNDLRPGCEPIFVGRFFGEMGNLGDLTKLFKTAGRGQLHAQTWKKEDGKHPTNIMIDENLIAASEELAEVIATHPGTFFVPKPSPKDRDWGCQNLPIRQKSNRLSHMSSEVTGKIVKPVMAQNVHPTVKPIELMRRLIRLVSRPDHTIIDPFMGSGTTGIAAVLEGRNFIGIEREPDYFNIAKTRILSALEEVSK